MKDREDNIFLMFLAGVLTAMTIAVIVSEDKKRRKIVSGDFNDDKENLSKDLSNIYIDLTKAREKLTQDAQF